MEAIIKNHKDLVMGTMRIFRRFRGYAFFCLELGFVDFILEGDAKQVIKVVKDKESNLSTGALIA